MDFKSTPPWQTIGIPAAKLPLGPTKLRRVIDELDVENAPRYRADALRSWCNIFVTDVLTAMDLPPTHWVREDGSPSVQGKGQELNANRMAHWFAEHGPAFGWVNADRKTAVDAAARGHVVVVTYENPDPRHSGHVAILLPEGTIAQAGRHNFVGKTIREGFGNLPVEFWIQSHGGSHSP